MKALKIVLVVFLVYVGIVVAFESLIGILQPTAGSTMLITTFDEDGTPHERVVSRLETDGQLYVAANHWPRAWYEHVLANPRVRVTLDGETADYQAVPIASAEYERVDRDHSLPLFMRILTGFPPREIVRLDPGAKATGSG